MFSTFMHIAIATLNMVSIICSSSRGAWLTLLIGIGVCLLLKIMKLKKLFLVVGCSCLLLSFLNLKGTYLCLENKKGTLFHFDIRTTISSLLEEKIYSRAETLKIESLKQIDGSAFQRIESAKQAFKWWQESPVIGIGLGQFLVKQGSQSNSNIPVTIHSTPLWLLTETGVIGLLLFVIFITTVWQGLLREIKLSANNALAKSGITILISFSIASLAMEVLYQRYLWFFLGIVLCQEHVKTMLSLKTSQGFNFIKQNYSPQFEVEKKLAGYLQESLSA
jgi:O-antigen ligase